MGLSKRKSSPITVSGIRFRYTVNTGRPSDDGWYPLNLTIRNATGSGPKILGTAQTRDSWLDISNEHRRPIECYRAIKPSVVATVIEKALQDGWDPFAGENLRVDISDVVTEP